MNKVYITGDNEALKEELSSFLSQKNEIVHDKSAGIIFETTVFNRDLKSENLASIEKDFKDDALIVSASQCITVLEQQKFLNKKNRLAGMSLYPTFTAVKGIEISGSGLTAEGSISRAKELFEQAGKEVHITEDRPGMVNLRIVSLIINEAYLVLQEGTSNKKDIDTAMKLGTNYPYGPIEWSERIGIDIIYNVLLNMYEAYGDDRYRVTPLLREKYLEVIMA